MNAMTGEAADYSAGVWEHFRAPRNAGVFPAGMAGILAGRAGSARHGREVEWMLRLDGAGRITACRYRVYGCPATIALCSRTSEMVRGMSPGEAAAYSVVGLAEELGLPAEKRAAALVVEDALRAALTGYNSKQSPPSAAMG